MNRWTTLPGAINKAALSARIAEVAGLTHVDAARALDAALGAIEDALVDGHQVVFSGFGKFYVGSRAEHLGVNPRTGEVISIPGHKVPRFTAGSRFKEAVRGQEAASAASD